MMRAELAPLVIGALIIATDFYVKTFHPGIQSAINSSAVAVLCLVLAAVIWLAKHSSFARHHLASLEHPGDRSFMTEKDKDQEGSRS